LAGKTTYKFTGRFLIATVTGYADLELMRALVEVFQTRLDEGCGEFVFDFSGMTQINSSALGELLEMISQGMGRENVRFSFCAVPPSCRLGIDSLGIFAYVDEYDSVQEALQHIEST